MLLAGKVALVSGIGPGLGQAIALALARHGADVAIAARTESVLASAASEVEACGRQVIAVPTDITRADDCEQLVERTEKAYGRIDVLVGNAFHPGSYAPIEHDDIDRWRLPFEVNVLGSMRLVQAVIPVMKKRGQGSIVFINSMIIRQVVPTMAGYAASKAALMAATQTLARELGAYAIRVNSVVPGYIWGPALERYFAAQAKERGVGPERVYAEVARQIALGRIPTSEEVADAAVFFASDLSRAVTGASLDVNGGHVFH